MNDKRRSALEHGYARLAEHRLTLQDVLGALALLPLHVVQDNVGTGATSRPRQEHGGDVGGDRGEEGGRQHRAPRQGRRVRQRHRIGSLEHQEVS